MQFTQIPQVTNGELLADVRTLSVNPAIDALNTLIPEHNTLVSGAASLTSSVAGVRSDMNVLRTDVNTITSDLVDMKQVIAGMQAADTAGTTKDLAQDRSIDSLQTTLQAALTRISTLEVKTTRVRTYVDFNNLNLYVGLDVPVNLIQVLKGYTPAAGAWGQMVNLTTNRIVAAVDDDRTILVKVLLTGSFTGSPSNDTAGLIYKMIGGNITDEHDSRRTNLSTEEHFNYFNMISFNRGDIFTQEGTALNILPVNRGFTITAARLIIEEE